jgi:ATP synthase protein I
MKPQSDEENLFDRQVDEHTKRKMKTLRQNQKTVKSGLSTMGMIGWTIAMPTLLGALGGLWLDRHYPTHYSWTLTLLLAGLITGSVLAWYWVGVEEKDMHKET